VRNAEPSDPRRFDRPLEMCEALEQADCGQPVSLPAITEGPAYNAPSMLGADQKTPDGLAPRPRAGAAMRSDVGRWILRSLRAAGWAPLAVLGVHLFISRAFGAYAAYPPLDLPMHFLGGISIAYFFWRSQELAAEGELLGQLSRLGSVLVVLGGTSTAAMLWEFAEWISDRSLGTHSQVGLEDTLLDMALGIAGGSLYLVVRRILPTLQPPRSAEHP